VGQLQDVVETWRMRLESEGVRSSVEVYESLEEEGCPVRCRETQAVHASWRPDGCDSMVVDAGQARIFLNSVLSALPIDQDPVAFGDFDTGGSDDSGEFSPDEFEDEHVFRYDGPCGYDRYDSDGYPSDGGCQVAPARAV
jgi:hypothetical protein